MQKREKINFILIIILVILIIVFAFIIFAGKLTGNTVLVKRDNCLPQTIVQTIINRGDSFSAQTSNCAPPTTTRPGTTPPSPVPCALADISDCSKGKCNSYGNCVLIKGKCQCDNYCRDTGTIFKKCDGYCDYGKQCNDAGAFAGCGCDHNCKPPKEQCKSWFTDIYGCCKQGECCGSTMCCPKSRCTSIEVDGIPLGFCKDKDTCNNECKGYIDFHYKDKSGRLELSLCCRSGESCVKRDFYYRKNDDAYFEGKIPTCVSISSSCASNEEKCATIIDENGAKKVICCPSDKKCVSATFGGATIWECAPKTCEENTKPCFGVGDFSKFMICCPSGESCQTMPVGKPYCTTGI